MDQNTRLKQASNVTFQNVAGEAILIHLDTGTYFSLNKVGTQFWEMLDGSQTIAEQAQALADQYDVDSAMVRDDLLELALAMQQENLVEVA